MKELYSIGEVSSLFGISTQALRFYSNNGLIVPRHTDNSSGYRFYSYDQFHLIDRIKYLQNFGFSLDEIKSILSSGSVNDLIPYLQKRLDSIKSEISQAQNIADNLEWYIKYYHYLGENKFPHLPYKRHIKERYILLTPLNEDDPLFGPAGYNLAQLKKQKAFKDLKYLRQVGYILNLEKFSNEQIAPFCYYTYLKDKPNFSSDNIKIIPEGEYLCFRIKLLSKEKFDFSSVKPYISQIDKNALALADEYEDNLREFLDCTYEMQILI